MDTHNEFASHCFTKITEYITPVKCFKLKFIEGMEGNKYSQGYITG